MGGYIFLTLPHTCGPHRQQRSAPDMDSDVATISNSRGSKGEVLELEETKGTWWKTLGSEPAP